MVNSWPYERKILKEFRESRGNACEECGSVDRLEIHHRVATDVKGRERGAARAYEVQRHPEWFILLCRPCHVKAHPGGFRLATAQDRVDDMMADYLEKHPEGIPAMREMV